MWALVSCDKDIESLLSYGLDALHADGDLVASRDWFDAAYRAAETVGDNASMALAALGMGGMWVHEHRSIPAGALQEARLTQALIAVDPQSSLGLRLRARIAAEADYRSGDHNAILAVVEQARTVGDPAVAADAVSLAHHCLLGPGNARLRHALARELIAASIHTARRSDLLMGILWRTVDLFLDANPRAERQLAELRSLLARDSNLAIGFVVQAIDVMLAIRAGAFEQAEKQAVACAEQGMAAGDADAAGWYGAHMVAIRWYQGRIGELLPMLHDLVNSPALSTVDNSYVAALAVAAATTGDYRQAEGALARLCGTDLAQLPRSSSWLVSMYGIVECAYLLDESHTAAAAYEMLLPFRRLPIVASLGVACFGSVEHALGVAALSIGDTDRAIAHFHEAIRANLAIGHWPAAAHSRARLAQALYIRDGPGDVVEAGRKLAHATSDAEALGVVLPSQSRPRAASLLTCHRRGKRWELEIGYRKAVVADSVGMNYLATLLANPGHEIAAVELAAGAGLSNAVAAGIADGPAQVVLDETAKRSYRARLAELQEEIDGYRADNDLVRAETAQAERDWLIDELAAATGLGGRTRLFAGNDERARISVGKAIRRALNSISVADAVIGAELRATVSTGVRCCYRPIRGATATR